MTDLTAAIFTVRPYQAGTMPGYMGRAVYAQTLRWIGQRDAALADALHDSDGPKPLTCSTVVGPKRAGKNIRQLNPQGSYWFRVTALTAPVSALLQTIVDALPDAAELDGIPFKLESATIDPDVHRWANSTTYQELAAPYLLGDASIDGRVGLRFSSPTVFKTKGRLEPLPQAPMVFGSLTNRWNHFSPVAISPETRRFCDTEVVMSRFKLRSRAFPLKNRVMMGAVGKAVYSALNTDRYWRAVLHLLADFAFYSGVGYQTAAGLGQARMIADI